MSYWIKNSIVSASNGRDLKPWMFHDKRLICKLFVWMLLFVLHVLGGWTTVLFGSPCQVRVTGAERIEGNHDQSFVGPLDSICILLVELPLLLWLRVELSLGEGKILQSLGQGPH